MVREHEEMGYLYCEGGGKGHSNSPTMQSLSNLPHDDHHYEQPGGGGGCQEITDIPDDYLSQSQVRDDHYSIFCTYFYLNANVLVGPQASSQGSEDPFLWKTQ